MAKDEARQKGIEVLTVILVAEMIAAAIKGLATEEQVKAMIQTQQETMIDYIDACQPGAVMLEAATLKTGEVAQPPLDPAWLQGLIFKGAEHQTKIVEGRKTLVATPFERELTPEDVLGYRVGEDTVTIIAADGKKHVVEL